MPRIVWDRLSLSGFGRYLQTMEIVLHPALNVLVGPNETGKSTLIAGLTAVLFGLPATQDPTVFGQSRWRNWHHPARFAGELFFRVDGEEWHLARDFASNRVSLRQRLGDGWREVAQGVDNPSARRPLQRYHEQLHRLLGIERRELFQLTFCLTQPLPAPEELDDAVQSMLSGANSQVSQIQSLLERQVKDITRYYGEALGSGRDGNRDRRLQELQAEMHRLEQAIAAGRSAADGLQAVRAELQQVERERSETARRLQVSELLAQAWSAWRAHQERYQRQLSEQQQLEPALERAEQLQLQLTECSQVLQHYEDMAALGSEWPLRLERLGQLESERQAVHARLEQLESDLIAIRDELAPLSSDQPESLVAHPSSTSPADSRLAAQAELVKRLRDRLQSEFGLLETATSEQLALLSGYHRRQLELSGRQREAERHCLALQEREQAYQDAEAAWRQQYGPLRQDAERLLTAINQRMHNIGSRHARQQAASDVTSTLPWVLALLTVGAAYWFWGRHAGSLGLGGSLLLAVAAWGIVRLLGNRQRIPSGREAREASELGKLSSLGWAELLTARALLERLSRAQSNRPGDDLTMAAATEEEAADDLAAWQRVLAPFETAFPDPESAYRQWQELRQELRVAEGDLAAIDEGIRLGAKRQTESQRALAESRLGQVTEQQARLLRSAEQSEQAWAAELADVLASWRVTGNLDALRQRYQTYANLRQEREEAAKMLSEILTVFRAGSLEELQRQKLDLQNSIAALQIRWQELVEQHPGLPGLREASQSERVQELFQASGARLQELRRVSEQQAAKVEQLWRQQALLEGQSPCNVAGAEEQLRQLAVERDRLQLEVAALGLAYRELAMAKAEYESAYREELARQASMYFDAISGQSARRVELGPDFRVTLLTSDGQTFLPAQLSQGARDQLYFALRLAIADLLTDQCQLPLILDDPFVNSDDERLQRIKQALGRAAEARQILLCTHQTAWCDCGDSTIPLPPGE